MQPSAFRDIWTDLGAAFTKRNGCEVVDHFGDVEEEYWAVRRRAGAFDLSVLKKVKVSGPDAARFLDRVLTRKVAVAIDGRALYSPICNDVGGFVDECVVYRVGSNEFLLISGGGGGELRRHTQDRKVTIEDLTDARFCLAVQGPGSRDVLRSVVEIRLDDLEYYQF